MRKNGIAGAVLALLLGVSIAGCQDTKTLQENQQLKTHIADLEKENADLSARVDGLAKENSALSSENEKLKAAKAPAKKTAKGKHRKHPKRSTTSSN
jgi:regulator of replication initiation timing